MRKQQLHFPKKKRKHLKINYDSIKVLLIGLFYEASFIVAILVYIGLI